MTCELPSKAMREKTPVNAFTFRACFSPRIYIDIGHKDGPDITQDTTWMEKLLTKRGIAHEWHVGEGGHDADYWRANVVEYLRWYSQDWGSKPALQ